MKNPGLPNQLWSVLGGRLWHATGPDGLKGILADEEIRIVDDRYSNSLCRQLGCVALLDFGPTAVDDWDQFKNWSGWFGHQQQARVSVWLEIDRCAAVEQVIDAQALHRIWEDNSSKKFIPGVEAGHCGPVPVARIGAILLIDRHEVSTFERLVGVDAAPLDRLKNFERSLPPAPDPHPFIAAMEARRKRQNACRAVECRRP